MKTKTNQKRFCKRHFPIAFTLKELGIWFGTELVPAVVAAVIFTIAAMMLVELITSLS